MKKDNSAMATESLKRPYEGLGAALVPAAKRARQEIAVLQRPYGGAVVPSVCGRYLFSWRQKWSFKVDGRFLCGSGPSQDISLDGTCNAAFGP